MIFQSEAEYFAGRAAECRAAVASAPDVGTALAYAALAERYDRYSRDALRLGAQLADNEDL